MENTPAAPAEAPQAPESVATPTNTNQESAQAPAVDLHGFTPEDLAGMRTFIDNNGGWDKIKSRISNPEPAQPAPAPEKPAEQPVQPQQPVQQYRAPEGSISQQEFLAKQYFQALSTEEQYAGISKEIATGDVLKEMASFNIQPLNPDGSINDKMVRQYLNLKAQTVPAKATSAEPNASTAPTVEYIEVGENISNLNQAYEVLAQDAKLRSQGMAGHPKIALAEAFIKEQLSKKK